MKRQDPPVPTRGPARSKTIDDEVAQLKATPGVFFLVRENVSAGVGASYTDRGCRIQRARTKASTTKRARFDIYAMWPPEAEQ